MIERVLLRVDGTPDSSKRMRSEGIDFKQCSNAFLRCSQPQKLQQLADSLTPDDLVGLRAKMVSLFDSLL
jgi:hypothetical protein